MADDSTPTPAAAPQIARSVCPTSFEARNLMVAATAFSERILKLPVETDSSEADLKKAFQAIYLAACQGFDQASLKDLSLDADAFEQVSKVLQGLGFTVQDAAKGSGKGPVVGW